MSVQNKKWVFGKFLSFAEDEPPESVIIDGCPAFAKSLKEVFPTSKTY